MMALRWAAIGVMLGSAVLHGALGLRRPLDRTQLSFACIMTLLAAYLYFQWDVYRATTSDAVVEVTREQLIVVDAFIAGLFVFVPAYTKVRLPRILNAACWAGLAAAFVANLLVRYGLWYSGQPVLVPTVVGGEPYSSIVEPPFGGLQYVYLLYLTSLLVVALGCGFKVFLRGEWQRAVTFTGATLLILVHGLIDIEHERVGGSWPYIADFGATALALIMSVRLAHDFRAQAEALANVLKYVDAQARRLTSILESIRALEQNMHGPLDRLESGVAALAAESTTKDEQLPRLRRAVTRLREIARTLPEISATLAP